METPTTQGTGTTPADFLTQIVNATPGWSDQYGGPAGIATLCHDLQQQLMDQSESIAAIRVAAINELLKTHSGTQVAAMFGVTRSAISKAAKSSYWEVTSW